MLALCFATYRWEIGFYFDGLHHRGGTSKDEMRVEQTGIFGLRIISAAIAVNISCVMIMVVTKSWETIASQQISMILNDNTY